MRKEFFMEQTEKSKKKWPKYLYLALTLGAIAVICLINPEQLNFKKMVEAISPMWLWGALLMMVGFWLLDALQLHYLTAKVYKRYSFLKMLKVGLIGQYYAAITPASMGGQPVQAVYMKRDGIPVGYSSSILAIKFLTYQVGLCIMYFISMALHGSILFKDFNLVFWLSIAGLFINLFVIIVVVFLVIKKQWVVWLSDRIISLLNRFRIVKDVEKASEAVGTTLAEFSQCIDFARKSPEGVTVLLLISIAHFICYFSVSYFIYKGFGYTQYGYLDILPFQIYLYVSVSLIPTPGGTGVNEAGFPLFMKHFFPGTAIPAMLCWRLITYYSNILVGGIVVLVDAAIPKRKDKLKPPPAG
jgi:uncharacterized protein (TIRG00374 family)